MRDTQTSIFKVLTCGVFDILHAGHIAFFEWVREELNPQYFIVALNTDISLKELGRSHVSSYADRLRVLQAIKYIDSVIPMYETEPTAIINDIKPTIFVKGGDYLGQEENLPEYKAINNVGGKLIIYPHKTHSSRGIMDRIRYLDACRGHPDEFHNYVDNFYKEEIN